MGASKTYLDYGGWFECCRCAAKGCLLLPITSERLVWQVALMETPIGRVAAPL
jgi:hypothetical protein